MARPEPAHDTLLRPLGGSGGGAAMIISAEEQEFVDAVLRDLGAADWRTDIAARRGRRRGADGVLELHQPVHRRFQLVVLEAACHMPGSPRLDPRKIVGKGLVLRRASGSGWQGWMSSGPAKRGWLSVSAVENLDPSRPPNRSRIGAVAAIDAMIAARRGEPAPTEEVLPLFVAPPDLCAALGRTILYGIVPVASSERSEAPVAAPDYAALSGAEGAAMREHLSAFLKARPALPLPQAGKPLDPAWAPLDPPDPGESKDEALRSLALLLQQLAVELGAFEPTDAAHALMRALGEIPLPTARDEMGRVTGTIAASDFVAKATPILIGRENNAEGLRMPLEWPAVDATLGARLTDLALACIGARFKQLVPQEPKFDNDGARYAVRAFIRVAGHPGCPPKLVWSDYSEPFRILPWWAGEGPATRIALPDVSNRETLKSLKPNVTFTLPPSLANLLRGDMKQLAEGKGNTGGLDIMWLCSFSLPIITLCAFIVLNIFLSLFDLIFRWMAFIKICIPIPRPK